MSFASYAGLFGDIGESSVAVVMVKRAAQGLWWFVNVGGGRLHKKKIHQSVLVIIDPADSSAHGFKVILFFCLRRVLEKSNAGGLANIGIADRDSRFWGLDRL